MWDLGNLKLVRREERLTASEYSRLTNQPSTYVIVTDDNVGANVKLARIARRAQDHLPHCSEVSHATPVLPG